MESELSLSAISVSIWANQGLQLDVCQGLQLVVCQGLQLVVCQGLQLDVCQGLQLDVCQGLQLVVCQGLQLDVCQGLQLDVCQGLQLDVCQGLQLDVCQDGECGGFGICVVVKYGCLEYSSGVEMYRFCCNKHLCYVGSVENKILLLYISCSRSLMMVLTTPRQSHVVSM